MSDDSRNFVRENFNRLAPIYDLYLNSAPPLDIPWFHELEAKISAVGTTGNRLLDIGCGTGDLAIYMANAGFDVVGMDIAANMLIVARNKLRLMKSSIEERNRLVKHPYYVSDPNAKTVLSSEKPRLRFIEDDIAAPCNIRETFDTAVMVDTLSFIAPDDLDTVFANVSKLLMNGGLFCVLFFTDLYFRGIVGDSGVEREELDFDSSCSPVASEKAYKHKIFFKKTKMITAETTVEMVQHSHSLREVVSLFSKSGFQIVRMVPDSQVFSSDEGDVDMICREIEKTYDIANGVRKVLIVGRKVAEAAR